MIDGAAQIGDQGFHGRGIQQFEVHPIGPPDLGGLRHPGPGVPTVGEQVAALPEADGAGHFLGEGLQGPDGPGAELLIDGGGPKVTEAPGGEGGLPCGHGTPPVHHQDRTPKAQLE